jgi:hypothetical protein
VRPLTVKRTIVSTGIDDAADTLIEILFLSQAWRLDTDTVIRGRIIARGKSVQFSLQFKEVPSGPPSITPALPLEGMCTKADQEITLVLYNIKMMTDTNILRVVFGNYSADRVSVRSSMSETIISFILPPLSEDVIGPVPLSLFVGNVSIAQIDFECMDARQSELLYSYPEYADAGEEVITVTLGISRLGKDIENLFVNTG